MLAPDAGTVPFVPGRHARPRFKTLPGLTRAFRRWADTSAATPADVPGATAEERHVLGALGGIASAIAGDRVRRWPEAVRAWAERGPRPPEEIVDAVLDGLGRRIDPLSALYNASISAANRRRLGTVFTPPPLVEHMIDLASAALGQSPAVILDPGAGVGAFTIAAARQWPEAQVVAIDINVVTLGLLASHLAFEIDAEPEAATPLERVDLVLDDYLDQLRERFAEGSRGPVLTLGNPPYTRVQELTATQRQKAIAMSAGIIDSGHANLAVLFQAATLNHMRPDDVSCMVLPGSLGYTRASRGLRRALWQSARPVTVQRTPAATRAFTGRSVQAAVLVVGPAQTNRTPVRLGRVQLLNDAMVVLDEEQRDRTKDEPSNWFWTATNGDPMAGAVSLAQIAKVRRGVATGANAMFFLSDAEARALPRAVLTAAIPTLRGFTSAVLDETTHASWGDERTKRWLLTVPPTQRLTGTLRTYIEGFEDEISRRHLPSQRRPWYSITELPRPEILVSPLSKTEFKIVLNPLGAVPSNNLFGITMVSGGDPVGLTRWLRSTDGQLELRRVSRRYHGGSHKLEPRDLQGIRVPAALAPAAPSPPPA